MRLSLYNGNLEICQWLYYTCNIHIKEVSEYNFCRLCKYNYLDIIKWLYTINKIKDSLMVNRENYSNDQNYSKIKYWLYMKK